MPNGDVPVVLPKHISNLRIVTAEPPDGVTEELARRLDKFRIRPGDIVSVRTGSTGSSALVEGDQAGWLIGGNLMRLHEFAATVDSAYLALYLSLPEVVDRIKSRSGNATAVPTMSVRSFGRLDVVLPPLAEQQKIVTILTALDERIAAHRNLTLATEKTRASMADHLLGGHLHVD